MGLSSYAVCSYIMQLYSRVRGQRGCFAFVDIMFRICRGGGGEGGGRVNICEFAKAKHHFVDEQ